MYYYLWQTTYPLQAGRLVADKSLRLGFTIQNLDQLIERLEVNSVKIINVPKLSEWGYCAVIEDLDSRKIELQEQART